mgnify:CR=1 FL=1
MTERPKVDCESHHPEIYVRSVPEAFAFYTTKLGFTPGFVWGDPPRFAGVNLGEEQMFLRLGTPEPRGCAVYFVVGNADELYEHQRAMGVEILEPPGDREYELRDYRVRDLHGYELGFGHYVYNVGDALVVERVDVPVRLERRLAALLVDLAARKRMTVSSCLEETLLHTFDGVGPHTNADLRYIEALKEKHGIDYDTHASYRFVERT